MSEQASRPHLDVIDGLRGVAVLMVLLYHVWLVYGTTLVAQISGRGVSLQFLAQTGFLGVEVFFFLSGFCLCHPYAVARFRGVAGPPLREYAYRRAIKILPSYLLALTAFALLKGAFSSHAGIADYVAHLFFVHPWFPDAFQGISGPLWTVGIEAQFYVLFPLVCWALLRHPVVTALCVVAGATVYRLWLFPANHVDSFFFVDQLPAFLDMFTLGMLSAYLLAWVHASGMHHRWQRWATLCSVVALAAALALLWGFANSPAMQSEAGFFEWQARHRFGIAAVLLCVTLFSALALPRWQKMIANPLFVYLSVISYNLYLWHLEILVWISHLHVDPRIQLVVGIALALVVASVITYAFERPLLKRPMPHWIRPRATAAEPRERADRRAA